MQFKSVAVCALSLALITAPMTASAHEHFRHGGLIAGLVVGTAAVAAAVVTAPFAIAASATPTYYAPQPAYYAPQPQAYYAPAPVYYAPAPVYYAPGYYR